MAAPIVPAVLWADAVASRTALAVAAAFSGAVYPAASSQSPLPLSAAALIPAAVIQLAGIEGSVIALLTVVTVGIVTPVWTGWRITRPLPSVARRLAGVARITAAICEAVGGAVARLYPVLSLTVPAVTAPDDKLIWPAPLPTVGSPPAAAGA